MTDVVGIRVVNVVTGGGIQDVTTGDAGSEKNKKNIGQQITIVMQIEYEKPDVNGFIYRHFKNEKKLAD